MHHHLVSFWQHSHCSEKTIITSLVPGRSRFSTKWRQQNTFMLPDSVLYLGSSWNTGVKSELVLLFAGCKQYSKYYARLHWYQVGIPICSAVSFIGLEACLFVWDLFWRLLFVWTARMLSNKSVTLLTNVYRVNQTNLYAKFILHGVWHWTRNNGLLSLTWCSDHNCVFEYQPLLCLCQKLVLSFQLWSDNSRAAYNRVNVRIWVY